MVRFQTQGPGVSLQAPNWDAEYKRQTPFKQIVGLYNMWQSLSPDTRNWIASLFGGGEDEILDAKTDPRDPILDEVVNPNAGTLERYGDNDWREVGDIQYTGEESDKYTPKNPLEVEVGSTDPWGIGNISTEPTKIKTRRDLYPELAPRSTMVGNPVEFLKPKKTTSADLPSGHYDNIWRGLL